MWVLYIYLRRRCRYEGIYGGFCNNHLTQFVQNRLAISGDCYIVILACLCPAQEERIESENVSMAITNKKRAVLITGTSTGIGRAAALHFDRMGFRVFSAVRRVIDGDELRKEASEQLTPILMDVTEMATINRVRNTFSKIWANRY
jgi:hypothetical protein